MLMVLFFTILLLFIDPSASSYQTEEAQIALFYRYDSVTFPFEVPADGTIRDIANAVHERHGVRPVYRLEISYAGALMEDLSMELSDVGIAPESVLDISWRMLSDIELIFEMCVEFWLCFDCSSFCICICRFVEPRINREMFEFETYADFEERYPDRAGQEWWLGDVILSCTFQSGRIVELKGGREGEAPLPFSFNWDKVEGLTHLKQFFVSNLDLKGTIEFKKLPRSFERLTVDTSQLCGEIDFSGIPPGLLHLHLTWNQLSGNIDFGPLRECVNLKSINLIGNRFTTVDHTASLPPQIEILELMYNDFHPRLNQTEFPRRLWPIASLPGLF